MRGRLPPPATDRRVAFYRQEIAGRLFDGPDGKPVLPAHNIVVLWHVVDASYLFQGLSVSYPIHAELTRDTVVVAWHETYQHPLLSATPPAVFDEENVALEENAARPDKAKDSDTE